MSSRYSSWRDPNGALAKRLVALIDQAGFNGLTVREAYTRFSTNPQHPDFAHHGWISGALSTLHGDLVIARLSEKRDGCKIYVHPDFLANRKAEAQGRGNLTKEQRAFFESLDSTLEYWLQVDTQGSRFGTDLTKAERNHRLFLKELKGIWEAHP